MSFTTTSTTCADRVGNACAQRMRDLRCMLRSNEVDNATLADFLDGQGIDVPELVNGGRGLMERETWDAHVETLEQNAAEEFHTYGLSFDFVRLDTFRDQDAEYWRYQMSYGGPSEEIRIYHRGFMEFWLLDWNDGARIRLSGDDLATGQRLYDWFDEVGSVESERLKATTTD